MIDPGGCSIAILSPFLSYGGCNTIAPKPVLLCLSTDGNEKMRQPIDEVLAFFEEWATVPMMLASMRARFTDATIWENVGLSTTVGAEQAVAFMDGFNKQLDITRGEVVVDHIAAAGNVVLTERTDIFYRADGSTAVSIKLMGVFEMDGAKIIKWRDYFDTKGFGG
jgi:limonene-1,2-epoxide hydrolase